MKNVCTVFLGGEGSGRRGISPSNMVLHSVPTKSLNCHQDNRTGTVFDEAEETPLSVAHCVTTTILSNGSSPRLNDGPYNKANDGSPCAGNLTTTAYCNNYGNRGRTDVRFVSFIFLMHLIFCHFRKLYIFFTVCLKKSCQIDWI